MTVDDACKLLSCTKTDLAEMLAVHPNTVYGWTECPELVTRYVRLKAEHEERERAVEQLNRGLAGLVSSR